MNKVLIVLMFILLGTSLIVVSNIGKDVQNSFVVEYHNNKNLALPDLEGKTEITAGLYRLYNLYGVTVDYNVFNGNYIFNGVANMGNSYYIIPETSLHPETTYTISFQNVSGSIIPDTIISYVGYNQSGIRNNIAYSHMQPMIGTYTTKNILYGNNGFRINITEGDILDNAIVKIQIEEGQIATSYVVPKLVPVYKDNLTQQEKQEIGFGAFGGLSQIIRSVDNVIKPIGNFINGVLNLFK